MSHSLIMQCIFTVLMLIVVDPAPPKKGPNLPPLPKVPDIPVPDPSIPVTIYEGEEFIVDDTVECVVACFPPSALKISHRLVPTGQTFALSGKFIDGSQVTDGEREFTGPCWVYRCRVLENCDACWLMVLEVGGKKSDMQSRLLKCVKGPRPPPGPPVPTPTPTPTPVDPLTKTFQDAYNLETDVDRAVQLKRLIDLVDNGVVTAKASGRVTTTKQLQDTIHAAGDLSIGKDKFMNVRRAVGSYLTTKLGDKVVPMTDTLWTTATTEYGNVSKALKGVK